MEREKKSAERRVSPRFAVSLPITYDTTIPPFKQPLKIRAVTSDMGKGDLSFIASHAPSSRIKNLQIELPSKMIKAKARIVYSQPISEDQQDIFRTGVRFMETSKSDQGLLKQFLRRYSR